MKRSWSVGFLLLMAGCATAPSQLPSRGRSAQDYYPLALGNRWTYEREMLGEKRSETIEIVAQEGGYYVDSRGAKLRVDGFGVRDELRYLLQEPIEQDHAWKNTVSPSATERYRIESVGATCETPAGTFPDCVIVSSTLKLPEPNAALVNELTFARGVGLVKVAVDLEKHGVRTPQHRMKLTGYTLAPLEPAR